MASPAPAHMAYDPWCCSERDCEPAPAAKIQRVPGGFMVTVKPGEDPQFFPETGRRVSDDGVPHVCITPSGERRCVYVLPEA
jgi:hypothetical protein